MYSLFGLTNIADGVEDGNDYPQLSAEYIISAAPDLIFLADTKYEGQSLETVAARPGWAAIPAVANGNVIPMNDDIASRWGPRIVDYIKAVSAALVAGVGVTQSDDDDSPRVGMAAGSHDAARGGRRPRRR